MSRPWRAALLAVVLPAWMPSPATVAAQAPPERARLDSIRAAIFAMTDTVLLARAESLRIAAARVDRDNPLLHMELGWTSYRLGELTGARRRYEDAAGEFSWASDLRPAWPHAWHWLGLAELGVGEHGNPVVENIRQLIGRDALSLAARAFARALAADPGFAAALTDLAATALRQRISPRLVVAQGALRLAAATPAGSSPAVLLMRGRIERRLGEYDSALAAFRAWAELEGARGGVGRLEMARTFALQDRADSAVAAYESALRALPDDSLALELRREVRWIATPAEFARLDSLPPDSLASWLRSFWARRDIADARRPGARLVEQIRRYQVASERYSLVSRRRAMDPSYALRDTTQAEFDDRGIIYMRHGEPHQRASYSEQGVEPNESWMYQRAAQPPLIFHFVARDEVRDFRLLDNLAAVFGPGELVRLQSNLDARTPAVLANLYASRSRFSPIYDRLAQASAASRTHLLADERNQLRQMVHEGTTTDSWVLRYAAELRPVVASFLVEGSGGNGELHVVFAIPAGRLQGAQSGGSLIYPIALRLIVHDGAARSVASLDTLRVFRSPQRLAEGSWLTEKVMVNVPPGTWHYSFVVEEANRGSGAHFAGSDLVVPRYGEEFEVSDVVLGREGSGLVWRREDGAVPLNPLQRFAPSGTVSLWYELYGLPQGTSVATSVRVTRRGGGSPLRWLFGRRGGVELAFVTVTDAPGRSRVRQNLELGNLGTGRYEFVVEFEAGGRRIERRAAFEVTARMP
jgi:tetratricopeptide (TPR) repeat protein